MLKVDNKHIKDTLLLAYPVAIGQFGHIVLGITDSIMVGKVNAESLAASALVNSLLFLVIIFGIGLSTAISPLVAIAKGGGKHNECGTFLRQGIIANVSFSIILVVVILYLTDLIDYLDQPKEIVSLAKSYMRIMTLSTIPFIVFQSFRQFLEGLSIMRPAMYVILFSTLINVFGNWLLIYGNWGFPALGLDGAGYASFITRTSMMIMLIVFVVRSKNLREYNPSLRIRKIDWKIIRRIFAIGIPSGFTSFFEIAAFSISAIMIGWISTSALAAHQIALSVAGTSFMIILGISQAATIRVGNFLGEKNYTQLRKAGFNAIAIAAAIMFLFGVLFVIFRFTIPLIFINEAEVVLIAASLLIVAALFQIFDGVQATGLGALKGITDVKVPMYITFFAYWVVAIPSAYCLGFIFKLGVIGIWIGLSIGLILAAVLFSVRFYTRTKKLY
ncbi:MAG: MATE family efflux transporter [Ignavibacteriales bacterium]|nr:MATE family efflux transporter [Ignavibacteriales bacterium]